MFKKYLHEPLFHFLLLGALLFAFYSWSNKDTSANDDSTMDTIVLTQAEVAQLSNRWEKTHFRLPTVEEKQELIDKAIYTKVMYKEALKMGLDKNDLIIRRRLAQKMEFLSEDMAQLIEPTDEELVAYMHEHADLFTTNTKVSFLQVYIDPNKHKGTLDKVLDERLTQLRQLDTNNSLEKLSDAFMFPIENKQLSKEEVIRDFGKIFADTLFTLDEKVWQKAIKSSYGLHFVFISKKQKGKLPVFEDVRFTLYNKWMDAQREETNKLFYDNFKKGYKIEIEKSSK